MWDYHQAMAHYTVCVKVACRSNGLKMRHQLAQVYDEICRKEWAERTYRGDSDFCLESASLRHDPELFTRACEAYELEFPRSEKLVRQEQAPNKVCACFARCVRLMFALFHRCQENRKRELAPRRETVPSNQQGGGWPKKQKTLGGSSHSGSWKKW